MNTQILTAILSKDSKDATYKYALLRAMVQGVSDQSPHKGKAENGWVSYPFGLLIYYWLLYYYPIFASKVFIPQKNGETPELRSGTIKTASYYGLIKESGTYFILPKLHELMNEIGTLIIGQDSIISGWAGFTF